MLHTTEAHPGVICSGTLQQHQVSWGAAVTAMYLLCIHGRVLQASPSVTETVLMNIMTLRLALNIGIIYIFEKSGSKTARVSNAKPPNLGTPHLEHVRYEVQVAR